MGEDEPQLSSSNGDSEDSEAAIKAPFSHILFGFFLFFLPFAIKTLFYLYPNNVITAAVADLGIIFFFSATH